MRSILKHRPHIYRCYREICNEYRREDDNDNESYIIQTLRQLLRVYPKLLNCFDEILPPKERMMKPIRLRINRSC